MSYLVLARKWRPQGLDDLIGQEAVVRTLKNALKQGRVAHAYLFSGPRGVGKTSTARILAKAMNCTNGPTSVPCNVCPQCQGITDGSSVDVLEIDGASNTGVDDVRELRDTVKYAPASSRYKVYIIDEVHMLSGAAFNALLKTLEEPPPHVVFIFATTSPKKIPATILSRCQHLTFKKIPRHMIKERLSGIMQKEGFRATPGAIEAIAQAADGSMRDSLTILDQALAFSEEIKEEDIATLLGLPEKALLYELTISIIAADRIRSLDLVKGLVEKGYDLRVFSRELTEYFRNILIIKVASGASGILDLTEEEISRLQRLSEKTTLEELTLMFSELVRLENEMRTTPNPRYLLELSLIRLSFLKGMIPISEALKRIEGITTADIQDKKIERPQAQSELPEPQMPSQADRQAAEKTASATEDAPPASAAIEDSLWDALIKKLEEKEHHFVYQLAKGKVVNITDKELVIGFNGDMPLFMNTVKKYRPAIEDALKEIKGSRIRIKVVPLVKRHEETKSLMDKVKSEPIVMDVLNLFNGKILEVKSIEGHINNGGKDDE